MDPFQFMNDETFDFGEIDQKFPNAKRQLENKIFISHSGKDYKRIIGEIRPLLPDRFRDGGFCHNRRSGGAGDYKLLIRFALRLCTRFMVVVSQNSIQNPWVKAEVNWAMGHYSAIISCRFDDADPTRIDPRLALADTALPNQPRIYDLDLTDMTDLPSRLSRALELAV